MHRCVVGDVTPSGTIRDAESERDRLDLLYRDERLGMVRLAFLLTGSNETANDLVHDAFIKVTPKLHSVAQPGAYLRAAVVNECRMWLRRSATEARSNERTGIRNDAVISPEIDETLAAVRALPARRAVALVLRYYADLPDQEIAEILGCRPSTVRSHIHRGLQELREVLSDALL